ncbi:hypothetical protein SI65_05792 [Aspergillus cristatus]|uniref:Ribonuclease H2 subunit B n=1 Tax=Aspergillus cristatus TaxID=573508 RepID=A0A1E3BDW9_ASPCR|nr:hypothetical protein SI65_05792 [Aspergillus cristatus]
MRTRSTAPSSKKTESNQSQPTPKTLTPAERPSKTFILPTSASDDARFVSLPNPRTGALNRYFFCPEKGVYEFTVVAPSPQQPRSFLFTSKSSSASNNEGDLTSATSVGKGSISKVAELLVATPIDFVFFMVPLLSPESTQAKKLFQPLDDIIDSQDELPKHLHYVLYTDNFRETLKARAETICDTVEAGDEKMFRFSETKFLKELISKAERMVAQGLPASLEERFIRQALVTPMMAVKRENPTGATPSNNEVEGDFQPEKQESQSTTPGATSSDSATPSGTGETGESTPATEPTPTPDEFTTPDNVTRLLRISTALAFMKESYIPPSLCARLDEILASPESPLDFKPLQERLEHIAKLRAEALASRSLGDFSRKRGAEDEDAAEARAEKRRKEEEEKKKKSATLSRGVKDLQKVNTSGMKKMSDFFGKAAAKKKS